MVLLRAFAVWPIIIEQPVRPVRFRLIVAEVTPCVSA